VPDETFNGRAGSNRKSAEGALCSRGAMASERQVTMRRENLGAAQFRFLVLCGRSRENPLGTRKATSPLPEKRKDRSDHDEGGGGT